MYVVERTTTTSGSGLQPRMTRFLEAARFFSSDTTAFAGGVTLVSVLLMLRELQSDQEPFLLQHTTASR